MGITSQDKVKTNQELLFLSVNNIEENKIEFWGDILYDSVHMCEKLEVVGY